MRPDVVIVLDPLPNDYLSFLKAVKDLPIQKIVPEGAIKALTKAILPRTTWGDVSSFDAYAR